MGRIDQGVQAAIGEGGIDGKVIKGTLKIHRVADIVQEKVNLVADPAKHKADAHKDHGLEDVLAGYDHGTDGVDWGGHGQVDLLRGRGGVHPAADAVDHSGIGEHEDDQWDDELHQEGEHPAERPRRVVRPLRHVETRPCNNRTFSKHLKNVILRFLYNIIEKNVY